MGPEPHELVLSVDPGKDQGWALHDSSGRLLVCGLGEYSGVAVETIVVECPQIYSSGTSRADPNDLIRLAVRVGIAIERSRASKAYLVSPRTWAGQVPKAVRHARLKADLALEGDLGVVIEGTRTIAAGKVHNVLDAVGIGRWFLLSKNREAYRW